jgi:peptide/nickel transport system substrate-binding protein
VALDWPVYLFTVSSRKKAVSFFFLGWAPDYADPDDYATPFMHSPPAGFFPARIGYKNASLDALIDQAAITVDPTARAQLYAQIQKSAYEDDVAYLWTHQSVTFDTFRDYVKGFVSNPMTTGNGEYIFYDLSKG